MEKAGDQVPIFPATSPTSRASGPRQCQSHNASATMAHSAFPPAGSTANKRAVPRVPCDSLSRLGLDARRSGVDGERASEQAFWCGQRHPHRMMDCHQARLVYFATPASAGPLHQRDPLPSTAITPPAAPRRDEYRRQVCARRGPTQPPHLTCRCDRLCDPPPGSQTLTSPLRAIPRHRSQDEIPAALGAAAAATAARAAAAAACAAGAQAANRGRARICAAPRSRDPGHLHGRTHRHALPLPRGAAPANAWW
eukprot:365319-Chlamydomonas_euryale.AAC.7